MTVAKTSPASAVGRGAVLAVFGDQPVMLSFGLNTLLAYTKATNSTPSAAVELLATNALGLIRGLVFHALIRAGIEGIDEDKAGEWLETLDDATGGAIGAAIGAALTVPNPTMAGLQNVMIARVNEINGANGMS